MELLTKITRHGVIQGHYDDEKNLETFDILYDGDNYFVTFLRSPDNQNEWLYRIKKEGELIAEGNYTKI